MSQLQMMKEFFERHGYLVTVWLKTNQKPIDGEVIRNPHPAPTETAQMDFPILFEKAWRISGVSNTEEYMELWQNKPDSIESHCDFYRIEPV